MFRALTDHPVNAGPRVPGWLPRYLVLHRRGELRARVEQAVAALARCRVCPRDCDVNRLTDQYAFCRTGRHPAVSSHFPHFGEEDCLRGRSGSGTIFYTHCNLRCVFCQNWEVSWGARVSASPPRPPAAVAAMMLELQHAGCHNINVVTPEHVVPQVLEALLIAADNGLELPLVYNTSAYDSAESLELLDGVVDIYRLELPLVYNTSAYDSAESLELLDGVVDIYMPDFKYWSAASAERYLKAANYPEVARERIREMQRQVGPLRTDSSGLAYQGVLIRHLVMPGSLADTEAILRWIAEELGPESYVNLMDQYHPSGRVGQEHYPELARRVSEAEWRQARQVARAVGVRLDARRAVG